MDPQTVSSWLDRYERAWRSRDQDEIGSLFTEDATYSADPFDDGLHGRQAIVDEWLSIDPNEEFDFRHEVLAVEGNLGVARGWITYTAGENLGEWSNIFLIRLDDRGRCNEYREWYMARKD
ncbi:MAG: nuclear transport factor 2 family protein [Actinomycetota bacterium]|nr:nuclear transport factor 2 family protein [Actinomycetota bacterium]